MPAALTLRAAWEDGTPLRERYPFKLLAVGPGVNLFAAIGSLDRPTSSLGPRDRCLVPVRRASAGVWRGRFVAPSRGRWRIVVLNFVGATRNVPPFAQLTVAVRAASR